MDAGRADAARNTLLLRLALAVLAGVLVMGTVGMLARGRPETPTANGKAFRA